MKAPLPNGRSGKTNPGPGVWLPKSVFDTSEFRSLSHRAARLLIAVMLGYNKRNNGSIRILFSDPRKYGFGSRRHMEAARDELLLAGWIQCTRVGGRNHIPSLYALTWEAIDANDAAGVKAAPPPGIWRRERSTDREALGAAHRQAKRRNGAKTVPPAGIDAGQIVPPAGIHAGRSIPPGGTLKPVLGPAGIPPGGKVLYVASACAVGKRP